MWEPPQCCETVKYRSCTWQLQAWSPFSERSCCIFLLAMKSSYWQLAHRYQALHEAWEPCGLQFYLLALFLQLSVFKVWPWNSYWFHPTQLSLKALPLEDRKALQTHVSYPGKLEGVKAASQSNTQFQNIYVLITPK